MTNPLRILFLVSRAGSDPRAAGGDVQGSLYARLLAQSGHEVTYLTSSFPGSADRSVEDSVEVIRLGRPESLAARMWQYYRRWGHLYDLVYAEAFGGARVPFCAPLYVKQPLLAAWYQVNTPVFRHQYGRLAGAGLSGLERQIARMHRRATLVTPSQARRADLVSFGFRPEHVEVVPPFALGAAGEANPVAHRSPVIVWLGKLRRYKCIHHVVDAMPGVLAERPDARLVVAGRRDDTAYERELREQVKRLGLTRAVSFSLDLTEGAKLALLRSARVITLPSPVEGFGIVLLEAAAQGTPAVVSEGVPEEVIREGYNGLRVPFGDARALGGALSRTLTSDSLHEALAEGALENASRYTADALIARLNEVVQRALAGRAPELAAAVS
ncbi:MAG TPA: glycosyltransferase family 4 protein [Dehalococcoidia bacterium]|nr:glycosyltransferase family 4 protein [Dehalococcoidia bacterium]